MARPPKPWRRASAGNAWYAQVRGVKVRLAGPEASFEDALKVLYRLLATEGDGRGAPRIGVRNLCGLFLDHIKADRKPRTYDWYRRHLKSFVAAHGERAAADVRPHHVADWSNSHGWGASTRAGAVTAVKASFAWGRKMGHLETDPVKDLAKPRPARREKILSGDQVEVVLEDAAPEFSVFLEFLRETGARPGEGAALTTADVAWGEKVAVLRAHKTEGAMGKPRLIVLSDRAEEILRGQAARWPEGPLFRNARGNPWTRHAMACAFRRLRARTGLGKEATAQALRHRFATDAARQLPNTVVAALLGHKSTAMVDRVYSHISDEIDTLKGALDKIRPPDQK